MRKLVLFLGIVILFLVSQTLFYYKGIYVPPDTDTYKLEELAIPHTQVGEFSDVFEVRKEGCTALFDVSHDNDFSVDELSVLYQRIISRNCTVKYLRDSEKLNESLEKASSFVVVSPKTFFSDEELLHVEEFLNGKGALLLVGDPGRGGDINSISLEFGIAFERDYMYNLVENDGNHKYVIFKDFESNEITKNLTRVAFYTACSLASPGNEMIFSDDNTHSSQRFSKRISPAALLKEKRVFALCDFTFMTSPYNEAFDNNRLISNIADYITSPKSAPYVPTNKTNSTLG